MAGAVPMAVVKACNYCLTEEGPKCQLKKCGACKEVTYCSVGCQKKDWTKRSHKNDCKLMQSGKFLSCQEVNRRLVALGVEGKSVSKCVRAAIQRGYIKLKGEDREELNQVIFTDKFDPAFQCGHKVNVKLKNVLYQPDYVGNDNGLPKHTTINCQHQKCMKGGKYYEYNFDTKEFPKNGRMYLIGMCKGEAHFEVGKGHNHCTKCPGFGSCVYDYRSVHCPDCGRHYFSGGGPVWAKRGCPCKCPRGCSCHSDHPLYVDWTRSKPPPP